AMGWQIVGVVVFFFSSRRRHTRLVSDWSSDVCSSDLAALRSGNAAVARTAYINGISAHIDFVNARNLDAGQTPTQITAAEKAARSEERRVGKEGRSRRAPSH